MEEVILPHIGTVAAWREKARGLAARGVPAEAVLWRVGDAAPDLFGPELFGGMAAPQAAPVTLTLPRAALGEIECALHHSDPERFARAYDIVLRLSRGDLRWGDREDPALHRLIAQAKHVRRDIHKMHAFVRFREITAESANRRAFAAWFEPDHPIVEPATPFFAKRFGDMDWVIATPSLTARFEAGQLSYSETEDRSPPPEDATEELWRTYFTHIFNPARLMVKAMTSEMPRKYWKNLPEAQLIPEMIRQAPARARAMQDAMPTPKAALADRLRPAPKELPSEIALETMKPALDACRRCAIGPCATQGVAGEGPASARVMVVGEQPGEQEDLKGRPFIGPAGQLFDQCARAARLDRERIWLTNAVKHFKFTPRGKQWLHQAPNAGEVKACRWWLDLERQLIKPDLVVAMGATAAASLTGTGKGLVERAGQIETLPDGTPCLITYHPAHLLRLPDPQLAQARQAAFTASLRRAADWPLA
ncbi:UdgX family uracil-DNA binding protein (plasmid) [Thioclava litoralis]|uniref:Type-4 uracil-DNA glycosylase n=1 Tax=Thioclava litoralis TaxID=3076557 RepID=A0ABZ1E643_9RHOB|nr:UdgX family uracil-DNA binding protein [Thioclava sp. FTW29]